MATHYLAVAAVVALLALTSVVEAQTAFRHQFQYDLKPEHEDKVGEIIKRWTSFAENAPAGGKPLLYQFGKDLGISTKLYSLSVNTQMDFAGRLDFPSEAALRAFWAATRQNPLWKEMNDNWVKQAVRLQYVATTCSYPTAGTYFRHSFEYQPKSNPFTSVDAQRLVAAWFKFCSDAPAKPASCVFGADLGIGEELYPGSGKSNMGFGGSLDFRSEGDLATFWKWVVVQPLYKDITKNNAAAARVQYAATFK